MKGVWSVALVEERMGGDGGAMYMWGRRGKVEGGGFGAWKGQKIEAKERRTELY